MGAITGDLRYAIRGLRREPMFAGLAVLSLALGIGANTAIFSLLDGLMLRQLRVSAPDRLLTVEQILPDGSRLYNFSIQDAERFEQAQIFASVSATTWADGYNVAAGAEVDERLARVSVVTGTFFKTMGAGASIGRPFDASDDREGGPPVVVISDAYWQRRFRRAPDVVGRTLRLNRTTYDIIGVAPRGFSGDWVGWPTDLWIPVAMAPQVFGESAPGLPRGMRRQFKLIARLAPGVSLADARVAAERVYRQMQAEPPAVSGVSKTSRLDLVSAARGYSPQRQTFARPLAALMAGVGAVLLIACANVANLLLARTSTRRREIAIRSAIGASRGRIFRLVMVEGLVLAVLAGGVGLLAAAWLTGGLADLARSGPVGSVNFGALAVDLDVQLDVRTLAFTLALCMLTPFVFALAPALNASHTSPGRAMSARGDVSESGERVLSPRKLLIVAQVALCLTLLVVTGLLVRSLINLKSQPFGFTRERLLLAWTLPGATGRDGASLLALWTDLQRRLASVPGVVAVSASAEGLLGGGPSGGPLVRRQGASAAEAARAEATMTVAPGFFATVGQPLLAGREFTEVDTTASTPVVIVNQALARRFFGTADPVGQRLVLGPGDTTAVEVVGIVADAVQSTPRARNPRMLYYPAAQNLRRLRSMCLAIRTAGDPGSLAGQVRQQLRATDPALPIMTVDTLEEQLDAVLFQDRLITNLAVGFGAAAAALAGAGLCAVWFYTVARRTREIGVRVALGASRVAVLRMILGETLVLVAAGIAAGLPLTLAATRLIVPRLFGVSSRDPLTIVMAVTAICAISLVAGAAPARRATRVDPMVALRSD